MALLRLADASLRLQPLAPPGVLLVVGFVSGFFGDVEFARGVGPVGVEITWDRRGAAVNLELTKRFVDQGHGIRDFVSGLTRVNVVRGYSRSSTERNQLLRAAGSTCTSPEGKSTFCRVLFRKFSLLRAGDRL